MTSRTNALLSNPEKLASGVSGSVTPVPIQISSRYGERYSSTRSNARVVAVERSRIILRVEVGGYTIHGLAAVFETDDIQHESESFVDSLNDYASDLSKIVGDLKYARIMVIAALRSMTDDNSEVAKFLDNLP